MKKLKLKIEFSNDEHDCDTCGWNVSQGAKVWLDDKLIMDEPALASCFDFKFITLDNVYEMLFKHLDFELDVEYLD